MDQIVLVGFLPMDKGCTCKLDLFGCGNSLVFNGDDYGVGMVLRFQMMVKNDLASYTICGHGTDGCCICFTSQEFAAGEGGCHLHGAIVRVMDMFTPAEN
jgi:hypothetical protein